MSKTTAHCVERGLVVLGFPSNDLSAQGPGTHKEVAEFCRLTYDVEFPMFEKSSVTISRRSRSMPDSSRGPGTHSVELPQRCRRSQRHEVVSFESRHAAFARIREPDREAARGEVRGNEELATTPPHPL